MSIAFTFPLVADIAVPHLPAMQSDVPFYDNLGGIAAQTPILTKTGLRAVGDLRVGDMVITRDRGLQPVRWIGRSFANPTQDTAVCYFPPQAMENSTGVWLSGRQQVLVRSALAEALFGESEVLVCAEDLVGRRGVVRETEGEELTLIHLLFDHHEVMLAEGLEFSSLYPCRHWLKTLEDDLKMAIRSHLPNDDQFTGYGFGPQARVALRKGEAQLIAAQ